MKIGFYGNCQAASYADAVRALCGIDDIIRSPETDVVPGFLEIENEVIVAPAVASQKLLLSCDLVFWQTDFVDHLDRVLDGNNISDDRLCMIPTFYFPGLFPDCVIEPQADGNNLRSPAGMYTSSIALYGFIQKLSVEETIKLFDQNSYSTFNFNAYWDTGKIALIDDLKACGLDGDRILISP